MAKDFGKFTLKLEYDKLYIKRIHLWIPTLNLQKDNLLDKTVIEKIQKGHHRSVLTLYLASGRTVKHEMMINIQPEKENFQIVNLYDLPQDVVIRPVNAKEKTILATEVKIEGVDSSFRPVRDDAGVTYALRPGKYQVKIVTPGMEVKSFPIEIKEDVRLYTLPLEEKEELRNDPRVEINVPAAYQTEDGTWHSTRTLNISSRGVCLIREPKSSKDKRILVRLLVPVAAKMVECFADVKWSKDSKVDTNLMGLALEVNDATRNEIRKFLEMQVSMKSSSHNFIKR
jgi:hypothetical protein